MAKISYWYNVQNSDFDTLPEIKEPLLPQIENTVISKPEYIIVSLIPEYGIMSQILLPIYPEGKYIFRDETNLKIRENIYIQVYDKKWFLYSIKPIYMIDQNGKYFSQIEITDQMMVSVMNVDEDCKIFVEYVNNKSLIHHNYRFLDKNIKIGNSNDCDIIYKSKNISSNHAEMLFSNNRWYICVAEKANEILINGKRTRKAELNVGDILFVMGLKLIIGIDFISINDENEHVRVQRRKFVKIKANTEISALENIVLEPKEDELFNRFPRRRLPLNKNEIRIEAPPMQLNGDKIPLMLRMGSSMLMGANSMLTGNYTMLLSSVLFPMLSAKYTDKQKKEYENRRVEKYTEYLDLKKKEIENERLHEESVLNFNYPELESVLSFSSEGKRLWERRKTDDDFLNIRLGYGKIPLLAKYIYPEERFGLDEDLLEDKMYELINNQIELNDVPIMNSFVENYVSGILGAKSLSLSFVKRLAMQIMLSHSYDEVKLIFLIEKDALNEMDYIRYVPHVWNDEKTFRFLAINTIEAFQISEYLKKEIDEDLKKKRSLNEILKRRPYYVVFALNKKIFDSMEVLKEVMKLDYNCGISIVTAFDNLPKECFKIFQLNTNGNNEIIHIKELDKTNSFFRMDRYDKQLAKRSMKELANTNLKVVAQSYSLPKTITFLEMYGVGKIEHLNAIQRWRDNNPVKSLVAPVGIGTDGMMFGLDLHEKTHGPHGLIAGMTGSGKSEFIITYILSMAINYHPNEVAFLLIDYKGGGLARAFENKDTGIHLPHLVGTITNLDGTAIQRSLISIKSELTRRQIIFNEAKTKIGESNMDIYTYQRLYRNKLVDNPLPHLFIIADEFAEMKQQQPDFMNELISTARIGRSLGVHLILATQKPSGVVNEQIRSNTKFRVCLKVQDKSDSMDMLKRPEGAEIKETGRFYLQVGYNEFFGLGQSAWSGAVYEEQEEIVTQKDNSIMFVDINGQNIYEARPEKKTVSLNKSQLTAIVQYLSDIAVREKVQSKQLWKNPLTSCIDVEKLDNCKYQNEGIKLDLGILDEPQKQRQMPLSYDFHKCQNIMIFGESKSGKTTLLQTIVYQLASIYTCEQVNFYILDYSSRMMKMFKKLPHCGAVLTEEDNESIEMFFELIISFIKERKKLYSKLEVDNYESALQFTKLPLILVIIDNLSGLNSFRQGTIYYDALSNYMKEAVNYGIKFIITTTHLNESTMRIKQETGDRIALKMKDKYEYSEAINVKCQILPSEIPGRGLYNFHGEGLEVQFAMYQPELDDTMRNKLLKKEIEKIANMNRNNIAAVRLPEFNEKEAYHEFSMKFDLYRIPLGYNTATKKAVALPFKQWDTISIYFGNIKGKVPILRNLLNVFSRNKCKLYIFRQKNITTFNDTLLNDYSSTVLTKELGENDEENQSMLETAMFELYDELTRRKVILDKICRLNGWDPQSKDAYKAFPYMLKETTPFVVIFENFAEICNVIQKEGVMKGFSSLLTMGRVYNVHFITCHYANDEITNDSMLFAELFKVGNKLFFGGQYHKQHLMTYIEKYAQVKSIQPYNEGFMIYQDNFYSILMPDGEIIYDEVDKDDESIF